jgi:3,4-dihydroxy 2-butanone 4-phosphate synthase/GTP cyclohydrolase II
MTFDRIDGILADLQQGKMVIVMDDENRENEGDLLMAAALVRPEDINFMARYGRGLICLTLTRERCQQLRLPLMVQDNATPYSTNFTVSIEAARGVTTGISAYDRAPHHPHRRSPRCQTRRFGPARPHLSVDGSSGRRIDPCRSH